jgi:hypothetical protein
MSIPPINAELSRRAEPPRDLPLPTPPSFNEPLRAASPPEVLDSAAREILLAANQPLVAPPIQRQDSLNLLTKPEPNPLWRELLHDSPGWLLSMILHTTFMLGLALWMLPQAEELRVNDLIVEPGPADEPMEALKVQPLESVEIAKLELNALQSSALADSLLDAAFPTAIQDLDAAKSSLRVEMLSTGPPQNVALLTEVGGAFGSGLAGRGIASRGALVREGGGSEASERAVALALAWLAEHQLPDGSWNFDQRRCPNCRGKCKDQGEFGEMTNAATALALLPFLGAGQTHQSGSYKKTVKAGIGYLQRNMHRSNYRHRDYGRVTHGDLTDPGQGMYSQGLAAIALCEAYGMTRDQRLRNTAQLAANFCITGQDRLTGGWGYTHGTGNDCSVAGWQIMAMKSARMAYLDVPNEAFKKAFLFLDSVQADGGAHYGYRSPGRGPGTTAVGLLCRMYMGWNRDNPALERGIETLAELGPARNNMYFNYYATQVMFQYTEGKGPVWERWNTTLRDYLIEHQATAGHEVGSWNECAYLMQGGRLYVTCLSAMCLEVYYRHMPIYQEQATAGGSEFPLD